MTAMHSAALDLDSWQRSMQSLCGQFETQLAFNRSLFIGEISTIDHGGLLMARLRTNAGLIARPRPRVDRDNDEHCFLVSQRTGFSRITQGGVAFDLAPGDLLLMDPTESCEIAPFGLMEHASISLSRREVERTLARRQCGRVAGKLSLGCTSGKMLKVLMDQLCDSEVQQSEGEEGEALLEALLNLLAPALRQEQLRKGELDSLQGNNLRAYVQEVIEQSLGQPGLTPISLANRLNISVRHLYRLFEEQGDSVCRYIQRTRLKHSAEDLANPQLKGKSITCIAYKWGFTDSAHFSRSFKKQYDLSPRDYRMQAFGEQTRQASVA